MNRIYNGLISFLAKIATKRNIFILTGIASTLWFLLRVIPKPTRAAYPCMRAAAPVMSAFVCYLISFAGTVFAFKAFHKNIKNARYLPALMFLGVFAVSLVVWNVQSAREAIAANIPVKTARELKALHAPGEIMGEPQGIVPGRVVWVWDNRATLPTTGSRMDYYNPDNNDQYVIDRMFTAAVISIAGEDGTVGDSKDIITAWNKIFIHFNNMRAERFGETSREGRGYQAGEQVFIKVNYTSLSESTVRKNIVESNPFMLLALLKHLVEYVGVNPADITVTDPTRGFYGPDADYVQAVYPTVKIVRNPSTGGTSQDIIYSGPVSGGSDALFGAAQADYVFNLPAIKGHGSAGYSATAKNFFGSNMRGSAQHYHFTLPVDNVSRNWNDYRVLVDLMASKHLGQKTVLYIADALYTGYNTWDGYSQMWGTAPFNGQNPMSLFVSLDQVAIESVCFDFLRTGNPNTASQETVEDFLHQAASPGNRPSGIQYNPDGNLPLTYSLGVHDHGSLADGYDHIQLVRIKSSDIPANGITWGGTSIEDLVNYPATTDVIYVKKTLTAPSGYADNIWSVTDWHRMDYQYLKGGDYVAAYEGWKGLNIKPNDYAGLYKYLYNSDTKEMYVLAKIKDNSFVPAGSSFNQNSYWRDFDVLEIFFAPAATSGKPVVTAATGYAQHVSVGSLTGGAYPVNHVIDVPASGVAEDYFGKTLAQGNIVKSGKVTQAGDYYYWELVLDINGIPQATFDNESTVKFSMAYNDIDDNNGINRTGQYGSVFNPGNKAGDSNAPFNNIASFGTVVFEKDIKTVIINPKTKTVTIGEQLAFSANITDVIYSIEEGDEYGTLLNNVLTATGEGTIKVRATSTIDGSFDEATITVSDPSKFPAADDADCVAATVPAGGGNLQGLTLVGGPYYIKNRDLNNGNYQYLWDDGINISTVERNEYDMETDATSYTNYNWLLRTWNTTESAAYGAGNPNYMWYIYKKTVNYNGNNTELYVIQNSGTGRCLHTGARNDAEVEFLNNGYSNAMGLKAWSTEAANADATYYTNNDKSTNAATKELSYYLYIMDNTVSATATFNSKIEIARWVWQDGKQLHGQGGYNYAQSAGRTYYGGDSGNNKSWTFIPATYAVANLAVLSVSVSKTQVLLDNDTFTATATIKNTGTADIPASTTIPVKVKFEFNGQYYYGTITTGLTTAAEKDVTVTINPLYTTAGAPVTVTVNSNNAIAVSDCANKTLTSENVAVVDAVPAPLATYSIKWTTASGTNTSVPYIIQPTANQRGLVMFPTAPGTDSPDCNETYFTWADGATGDTSADGYVLYLTTTGSTTPQLLEYGSRTQGNDGAYFCYGNLPGYTGLLQVVLPASGSDKAGKKRGLGDSVGGGTVVAEYDLVIGDISTDIGTADLTPKVLQGCFNTAGQAIDCNRAKGIIIKRYTDGSAEKVMK